MGKVMRQLLLRGDFLVHGSIRCEIWCRSGSRSRGVTDRRLGRRVIAIRLRVRISRHCA